MWTIKMPESLLSRDNSEGLVGTYRTNRRLAVCFALADDAITWEEACRYLGLDEHTLKEIYTAAQQWAADIKESLADDSAPKLVTDASTAAQPQPE
jgi:hypothetical protein